MKRILLAVSLLVIAETAIICQAPLQTRAEASGFTSTSDYNDVMTFISQLKKSSKNISVVEIARSAEGRTVPLLIIGKPVPKSAAMMKNDPRIVIYIQANIHAGEVEGKEATLMFVRDMLSEKNPELLKHVVFLICPLFNPDGNEKISPQNRTNQNGPVNGVGVRYNGQMLDLNRDAMKAESYELQGVIRNVFNAWDPAVFMDCHTTDGSFHVEPVTFTWMVSPAGNKSLIEYMRTRMIPEMSSVLLKKYNTENCYYGEFFDLLHPEKGWLYDASEPRYMTNYYGLRNRLSILDENYVHADFKSRVLGCYNLVKTLAGYADIHFSEIKDMLKKVDSETIERGLHPSEKDSFPVVYKVRPLQDMVTIKTYEAEPSSEPGIYPPFRKTDRQVDVTVPYFIDYYAVNSIRFPYAWILTIDDQKVTDLLRLHGIRVEKLAASLKCNSERFEITGLRAAQNLNQGHYTETVKGNYVDGEMEFPAGSVLVRAAQPLANLAAYLLEPQSNDGLLTWNFLDRYLVPQWGQGFNPYPVVRIIDPVEIRSIPIE